MPQDLAELKQCLERAFLPNKCKVTLWDYEERLKFTVSGPNGETLYEDPEVLVSYLMDDLALASCIHAVRSDIVKKRQDS